MYPYSVDPNKYARFKYNIMISLYLSLVSYAEKIISYFLINFYHKYQSV